MSTKSVWSAVRNRIRAAWGGLTKAPQYIADGYGSGFNRAAPWSDDMAEQVKHFSGYVYAAVRPIALAVADCDMKLHATVRGESRPIAAHPFLDLMRAVNPIDTRFNLLRGTAENLSLTGNAYWYVASDGLGIPREIWPLPPYRVKVIPSLAQMVAGYEYTPPGSARPVSFANDEIVHFKYPNPCNPFYGWSPLQAAAMAVDAHEAILTAQVEGFKNGVQPPKLFFSTPQVISDENMLVRLRDRLEKLYAGPGNAQRIMIGHAGLEPKRLMLTPQEMDYLKSLTSIREQIATIYGTPEPVMGLSDQVNRASAQGLATIFARHTVQPICTYIGQQLDQDMLSRYPADLRVEMTTLIAEDREENRKDAESAFGRGAMTVDELRAALTGKPAIGDDTRYTLQNLVPVGTSTQGK